MIHRLISTPLSDQDYNDEFNVIKYIATKNEYQCLMIDNILLK